MTMKLSRLTSNLLLACGIITLFSWTTRAYTWYANDLQSDPYLAWLHFPIIGVFLLIGIYLASLGIRGRRASRHRESLSARRYAPRQHFSLSAESSVHGTPPGTRTAPPRADR